MIQRYSREQITKIWQPENKYKIWLDIEIYAAEAMEKFKIIPKGIAKEIRKKAKINPHRIDQIEKKVKHDVIAFLTSITEKVGQKAKFLHQGMTSSDVLDTCFNIQLHQSGKIILKDLEDLLKILKTKSIKYKKTVCVGRSHGIHAEPVTFGLKLLTYYAEFKRNKKRMEQAINEISTCAISGAVGTFAHINPGIEQYVAKKLKFKIEPISTQVIPRNITGLARLIRSYAYPALENVVLWHERDISHSSVERNIGPDATVTLDFVLTRLSGIIKNLIVYPKNMQKNLEKFNGLIFSQSVLLKLTQKGMTRELAYKVVQKNAMKTWSANESFFDNLNNDKQIKSKLSTEDLKKLFNMNSHLRYINTIYGRVFKS
ncbi:MAG: adenylosuccinate lyase [Candidatus Fonsibacter ubiquis]|nr:adenylosuccinate lyase [Candidatus Fonsibacter ubiquis]